MVSITTAALDTTTLVANNIKKTKIPPDRLCSRRKREKANQQEKTGQKQFQQELKNVGK